MEEEVEIRRARERLKRRKLNIAFAVTVPILLGSAITAPILYGKYASQRGNAGFTKPHLSTTFSSQTTTSLSKEFTPRPTAPSEIYPSTELGDSSTSSITTEANFHYSTEGPEITSSSEMTMSSSTTLITTTSYSEELDATDPATRSFPTTEAPFSEETTTNLISLSSRATTSPITLSISHEKTSPIAETASTSFMTESSPISTENMTVTTTNTSSAPVTKSPQVATLTNTLITSTTESTLEQKITTQAAKETSINTFTSVSSPTTTIHIETATTTTTSTTTTTTTKTTKTTATTTSTTSTSSTTTPATTTTTTKTTSTTTSTTMTSTTSTTTATTTTTSTTTTTTTTKTTTKTTPTTTTTTTSTISSPATTKSTTTTTTTTTSTTTTLHTTTTTTTTTTILETTTTTTSTTMTTTTTLSQTCQECPNGFCFDIGVGFKCISNMALVNKKFGKYIHCGKAGHPDFAERNNGLTGKTEPLLLSDEEHLLWLTPVLNEAGEFKDEYNINTHAFENRGLAAYPKGGNLGSEIYHKDSAGAQNTEEGWEFKKRCDDEKLESCLTWTIRAVHAHKAEGNYKPNDKPPVNKYMHAREGENFLYLEELENGNNLDEFLWTLKFH